MTADFRCHQLQTVPRQLHVVHDFRQQRASRMRKRGAAEAGRKFFSDGCAAGLRAALQHQRLETGFGQIKGSHQPVVAAANNDDVASLSHRLAGSVFQNFQRRQPSGRAHNAAAGMRG